MKEEFQSYISSIDDMLYTLDLNMDIDSLTTDELMYIEKARECLVKSLKYFTIITYRCKGEKRK